MDDGPIKPTVLNPSVDRRESLANALPVAVVEYDEFGKVATWNDAATALFGWTRQEVLGTNVVLLDTTNELGHSSMFDQVRATRTAVQWDASVATKDGQIVDVALHASPLADNSSDGVHIVCSAIDRRPQQRATEELRRSEERFRSMVHHVRDVVFEIAVNGEITFISDAIHRTLGVPAASFVGLNIFEVMKGMRNELRQAAVAAALGGCTEFRHTFALPNFDRWMEVYASVRFDEHGNGLGTSGVLYDVTERYHREAELTRRADTDPLTGVLNREAFGARLDDMLDAHPHRLVSVCFVDLDHFKAINDRWGHELGDQVLTMVARALEAGCREGDLVGRLGGDEFLVASGPLAEVADAHDLARRLLSKIGDPVTIDSHEFHLSASVGVAVGTLAGGARSRTLIRDADHEMYKVKHARSTPRQSVNF
jgi:diguanylate cyclase (GGDEF)-like protein/PAS domain S-box-containing protein